MNIRCARATDQKSINRIVREAQIYPFGLDWKRSVIAEEDGKVIGVGQVKPHYDGTRELASIAVIPERRRRGDSQRNYSHAIASTSRNRLRRRSPRAPAGGAGVTPISKGTRARERLLLNGIVVY